MAIEYTNTWDEIQKALIKAAAEPNERRQAEDALKIKNAFESIEYQKEVGRHTKKLKNATCALAIFTALFFVSTIFVYISSGRQVNALNNLANISKKQVEALDALTEAVLKLPTTEHRLKILQKTLDELNEKQNNVMSRQKRAVSGKH